MMLFRHAAPLRSGGCSTKLAHLPATHAELQIRLLRTTIWCCNPRIHQSFRIASMSINPPPSASFHVATRCSAREISTHRKNQCGIQVQSEAPVWSRIQNFRFWTSTTLWKRAFANTFRCLVGCTLGDFSTMWFLQVHHPELGVGIIMATSSKPNNPMV